MSRRRSPSRSSRRQSPARSSKKGAKRGGFLRFVRRTFFGGIVVGTLIAGGGAYWIWQKAESYDLSKIKELPERTLVYDRNGILMGHVAGHGENRVSVSAKDVSPHFVKALIAREDSRFYQHIGVDFLGILRAMITNLKSGEIDQGASTITMQLARNSFGMKERSYMRKLLEAALSLRIEHQYSKEEILTCYMNRVYFGSGLYGIERAAQGYFMKSASELTLAEGAMLAGVIRGPSLLNPFRSEENAKGIEKEVLERLVASHQVTREDADRATQQVIELRPPHLRFATSTYPLQMVFDLLDDFLSPHLIEYGGLRIYTTIDSELQKVAQLSLDQNLTKIERLPGYQHPVRSSHQRGGATKYLQGAVVTLDNQNGGIVTLVGGRDFSESPFNRAFLAKRQVGSTFKPFVYSVAFHRAGLLPGSYISDDPIRLANWSPKNSDGTFTGIQPAAIGLIRSRNTMSVRVGQIAGIEQIHDLAQALKFGDIPRSPVVALGAFEASPVTLTSAYSTLAAGGVNLAPHLISRIEQADGSVLYQHAVEGRRIFPAGVAWMTSDILGKVLDQGTAMDARKAGYQAPAYGKTGTTDDYRDAWFMGYTDKLTTGVWVGLDRPARIMDHGYGSTLALPVWTDVMKSAEGRGFSATPITPPKGTTIAALCSECGQLASGHTRYRYEMPLPPDLASRGKCRGHGGLLAGFKGPQAMPIPGESPALAATPVSNSGRDGNGFGGAIRGLGRKLFGGGKH